MKIFHKIALSILENKSIELKKDKYLEHGYTTILASKDYSAAPSQTHVSTKKSQFHTMGSHKNKFQEFYHNLAKPDCGYVDFPKEGDIAKYDVDNIRWSIWNSKVTGKLQPKTLANLPSFVPGDRRGNILPNQHGGFTVKTSD